MAISSRIDLLNILALPSREAILMYFALAAHLTLFYIRALHYSLPLHDVAPILDSSIWPVYDILYWVLRWSICVAFVVKIRVILYDEFCLRQLESAVLQKHRVDEWDREGGCNEDDDNEELIQLPGAYPTTDHADEIVDASKHPRSSQSDNTTELPTVEVPTHYEVLSIRHANVLRTSIVARGAGRVMTGQLEGKGWADAVERDDEWEGDEDQKGMEVAFEEDNEAWNAVRAFDGDDEGESEGEDDEETIRGDRSRDGDGEGHGAEDALKDRDGDVNGDGIDGHDDNERKEQDGEDETTTSLVETPLWAWLFFNLYLLGLALTVILVLASLVFDGFRKDDEDLNAESVEDGNERIKTDKKDDDDDDDDWSRRGDAAADAGSEPEPELDREAEAEAEAESGRDDDDDHATNAHDDPRHHSHDDVADDLDALPQQVEPAQPQQQPQPHPPPPPPTFTLMKLLEPQLASNRHFHPREFYGRRNAFDLGDAGARSTIA